MTDTDLIAPTPPSLLRRSGGALGWLLALVVPVSVYVGLSGLGMASNSAIFLAIVALPIVMWPFALLPDFVPGLLAVVLILLVGAAPANVVLGGFASNGFLMIISILGLGALIRTSGLVDRVAASMINRLPGNVAAYALALFTGGLVLTPFLPSPAGRLSVTAPLVRQLESRIGGQIGARGRTLIWLMGQDGVTLLTASFLTAAPINLIVFSLLPQQERFAFQFTQWMIAAAVASAVLVAGSLVLAALLSFDATRISTDTSLGARDIPPRLSRREWGAITGITSLGIGVITTPLHLIPTPVLAFLIFSLLFAFEIMEQSDFVHEIDWSFIFLLGALVGLTNTMSHLGLTDLLVSQTDWLGQIMRQDFARFVLIVSGFSIAARMVIPQTAMTLVLVAALLPLAEASGVTAWVVGFVILMMTNNVIFDYQSPMHGAYRRATGIKGQIGEVRVILFRLAMTGVRIGAILLSIPYWKSMGIL